MKPNTVRFLLAILLLQGIAYSQTSDALLQRLLQDDKASIEALVLYPEGTRNDILQASLYPELVVRIGEMQRLTSQQFADLLAPMAREDQERLWELARYPKLVADIASKGKVTDEMLKDYPEDVHDEARWADRNQQPAIQKMNALYSASETAFSTLLQTYPQPVQQAFRNLVALPEVMSILGESLKMTVLVGDLYRRDPAWVTHKLDSLNLEVARRNAEDLQAWRDSLAANPEAAKELQQSAEEFRQSQGQPAATPTQIVQYTTVVTYRYDPYPWWYGYPTWYGYSYWYPYPYWYHWGYYIDPYGNWVVNWMPSPYFTWWYFHHPWHHNYYPHLTHHFLCYHEGHRDSPGGFHREVNNWVQENQNVFGKDWLKNDGHRIDRIKEFGQFETSYHNSLATQPQKTPTEQVYFETHSKDYPNLSNSLNASSRPTETMPNVSRPTEVWPTTKPNVDVPPATQPKNPVDTRPNSVPKNPVDTRPKIEPNPKAPQYDTPRNSPAPSYHQDTWQRADPKPSYTPRPSFSPKPSFSSPSSSPKGGKGRF